MPEHIQAPDAVKQYLADFVQGFQHILGDKLVGVYLHGSLALGSFNSTSSDIDLIVVVRDGMTLDERQQARQFVKQLDVPARELEMSVVTLESVQHFQHPTPYELHLPTDHGDLPDLRDGDLAAHFTVIKAHGVTLYGKPIAAIFADVPSAHYLDSIAGDAAWSYGEIMKGADDGVCSVPPYGVLNFCRILAYLDERTVLSKAEGGKWGLAHLPQIYAPVIQAALHTYVTATAHDVDAALLKQFASYANAIIQQANLASTRSE
jgi:streptomycin 3"-adenylyltransferase